MEKRNFELDFETAKEWFNSENETKKEIALQVFPELGKKELPKTWEDLGRISGFFNGGFSKISHTKKSITIEANKDIFATQEQAEASIALAQLSQLELACENDYQYMRTTFTDLIEKIKPFRKLLNNL